MIQEDIRKLIDNLIKSNSISNSFSDKFRSMLKTESENNTTLQIKPKTIIGIYYLYLFTLFNEKSNNQFRDNKKIIETSVENFNTNNLSSDDARVLLEKLITQNMNLKTSLEFQTANANLLPFAKTKSSIEIEKMFSELVRMSLLDSDNIKDLFIKYFDKFEKNKEIITVFEQSSQIQSEEFSSFLRTILDTLDSQEAIVDAKGLNESFTGQLINLFEEFFLKFKEKDLKPLNFNITLEKTLTEKNNESYFFYGNELEEFESDVNQPYVSQLEINSKINSSTINSSLPNQSGLWEMAGAIVINPVKNGIGIARFPYIDIQKNKVYISVSIEQEIDLSESENFYHQIQSMRISEVSDRTDSRRQLVISEIADSLDIPRELALYPSIIEEYLGRNKGVSIDFEIQKKILRYELYPVQEVIFDKLNGIITIADDVDPVTSYLTFHLLPSPKSNFIDGKNIALANDQIIGKISTEFQFLSSWYTLVDLDFPSKSILDKISTKIRTSEGNTENELWKLRFTISKVLDIFEAESLLITNIWRYIWHEKIPLFPFELLSSFLATTPSGAINKELTTNEYVQLSRGITLDPLTTLIPDGPYNILSEQKITIGKLISLYFGQSDKQFYLVYCDLNEIDILKKLNRDYSQNTLLKLSKRVSKALSLKFDKLEELLHPKYLLTYILFYSIQFNTNLDFSNLKDVISWLLTEFEMKLHPINKIRSIDNENFIIQVDN